MLFLIDTREPEPERHDWGWLRAALGWLFPWPFICLWLFVGGVALHGIPGMLFAVAALIVTGWRASKAYPQWGGLSDHKQ